jgi:hypothetical protein
MRHDGPCGALVAESLKPSATHRLPSAVTVIRAFAIMRRSGPGPSADLRDEQQGVVGPCPLPLLAHRRRDQPVHPPERLSTKVPPPRSVWSSDARS